MITKPVGRTDRHILRTVGIALPDALIERRQELGVSEDVAGIAALTPACLVALGENGVKTLDDLGDLASDELLEIMPEGVLSAEKANEVIMAARAHWFEDEDVAPPDGGDEDARAQPPVPEDADAANREAAPEEPLV